MRNEHTAAPYAEPDPGVSPPAPQHKFKATEVKPGVGFDTSSVQTDNRSLAERISKLEGAVGQMGQELVAIPDMESKFEKLRESLSELASQLQALSAGLQGTVGFAARENFVCNSNGYVAAKLTCTSCGAENWWGWYPETR